MKQHEETHICESRVENALLSNTNSSFTSRWLGK